MSDLFAVGIVAHESRSDQTKKLAARVKADVVSVDDGTLGCSGNHLNVLERLYAESEAEWLVVLEDDAVPVRAPLKHVEAALKSAYEGIVSFYLGTNYPRYWQPGIQRAVAAASAAEATWISSDHLLHAVAYAIRRDLVPSMLNGVNGLQLPIDEAITDWARSRHHRVLYTWPSLFDHLDDPTVLVHKDGVPRTLPRKAHAHGVPERWTPRDARLEF